MSLFIPEVLAPAGDMERLEAAVDFGADAVYLGGTSFGMRAGPKNFDEVPLKSAMHGALRYILPATLCREMMRYLILRGSSNTHTRLALTLPSLRIWDFYP